MGAASGTPWPHHVSDAVRLAAIRQALHDGTVQRVMDSVGWTRADIARRMNVSLALVEAWETGRAELSDYNALKLWHLVTDACRTPI